jgi:hypothetical protein
LVSGTLNASGVSDIVCLKNISGVFLGTLFVDFHLVLGLFEFSLFAFGLVLLVVLFHFWFGFGCF